MASWYSGSRLTAEQIAQIASQAGFAGGDLEFMVAVAQRESGYDPGAHRSDVDRGRLSGDRGLWQVNYIWDSQLQAAGIIQSKSDLFDPVTNAKAAMFIFQRQGRAAWGVPGGSWGGASQRLDIGAARKAIQNAQAQGMLSQSYSGGAGGGAGGAAAAAGGGAAPVPGAVGSSTASAPVTLPADAILVQAGGRYYATFKVGGGVTVRFNANQATIAQAGKPIYRGSDTWLRTTVAGGDAQELGTMAADFGTFGQYFNNIVVAAIGKNNPALSDPAVRRVLAEMAGRPDMSEAEFKNRLQATPWYQRHTQRQLEWNSLAEAERDARRREVEAQMSDTVFELVGVPPSRKAGTAGGYVHNLTIKTHLEAVASGKMGFGAWISSVVKPFASRNSESPYGREVRAEQEAQRQRPVDIENSAEQIRQRLSRWGLKWSPKVVGQWARGIVEKTKSDKDLVAEIEAQAANLYPTLTPGVEVETAAQPWIQAYSSTMEDDGSVFTPEVQRALQRGTALNDFITELKSSPKWLNTGNARQEHMSLADELGRRLGFVK